MSLVLTYDPGVKRHARASFKHRQLFHVTFEDAASMAALHPSAAELIEAVVVEKPRINGATEGKDPNDQMDLSIEVGDIRGVYRSAGVRVILPTPMNWKGQLKKPHHHLKVWEALTPAEREAFAACADRHIERKQKADRAVPLTAFIEAKIKNACFMLARTGKVVRYSWGAHNLLDAVGLGLRYLGRIHGGASPFLPLDKV